MNLRAATIVLLAVILRLDSAAIASCDATGPADGYVPKAEVAIKIAEAILVQLYGEAQVSSDKPFTATLRGDVWEVRGKEYPPNYTGNAAEIDISKRDGRVLYLPCRGE